MVCNNTRIIDPHETARRFSKMAWIQHYVNKNLRPSQDLKAGWRGADKNPECHPSKITKKSITPAREEAKIAHSSSYITRKSDEITAWAPSPGQAVYAPNPQREGATTTLAVIPRKPLPPVQETSHPVLVSPVPASHQLGQPHRRLFPPPPAAWTQLVGNQVLGGRSPYTHHPHSAAALLSHAPPAPTSPLANIASGGAMVELAAWASRTLVPNKNRAVFILGLLVCWDRGWYGLALVFALLLVHC